MMDICACKGTRGSRIHACAFMTPALKSRGIHFAECNVERELKKDRISIRIKA